jgi:hypothetical protein
VSLEWKYDKWDYEEWNYEEPPVATDQVALCLRIQAPGLRKNADADVPAILRLKVKLSYYFDIYTFT